MRPRVCAGAVQVPCSPQGDARKEPRGCVPSEAVVCPPGLPAGLGANAHGTASRSQRHASAQSQRHCVGRLGTRRGGTSLLRPSSGCEVRILTCKSVASIDFTFTETRF